MFGFGGTTFATAGESALFWPAQNALLVADLHLEKASSYAMTSGQMLPPYDSNATLTELQKKAKELRAGKIFCLGDNFHDDGGEVRLCGEAAERLKQMTREYDWYWILGNHDPAIKARWGGHLHKEMEVDGIMLRHNICSSDNRPEISGHFHPKIRMHVRRKLVSRRCFLRAGNRLILPAFGALTGGLDVEAVIEAAGLGAGAEALVPLGSRIAKFAVASTAMTPA